MDKIKFKDWVDKEIMGKLAFELNEYPYTPIFNPLSYKLSKSIQAIADQYIHDETRDEKWYQEHKRDIREMIFKTVLITMYCLKDYTKLSQEEE